MILVPAGPVQPHGFIGIGVIHPHASFDVSELAAVSKYALGHDVGGGLNLFFTHSVGGARGSAPPADVQGLHVPRLQQRQARFLARQRGDDVPLLVDRINRRRRGCKDTPLIADLHRTDHAIEDAAIGGELGLRRDANAVKQVAVTQQRGVDRDRLVLAGDLVAVLEQHPRAALAGERDRGRPRLPAEARVALRQRLHELVGRRLQVVRLVARHAEFDAVREDALSVGGAVGCRRART